MSDVWLLLETSGRTGRVGLARGGRVVQAAGLDAARRHARDLTATVDSLLKREAIGPTDIAGVMVGVGPGSYTGLRVGITTAKVLAYALGRPLVAVPTFRAIVEQVPEPFAVADVIADALQGQVYVWRFRRSAGGWTAADELRIESVTAWAERLPAEVVVTGPGVAVHDTAIPAAVVRLPPEWREPTVESLFAAGRGIAPLGRDDLFRLEPLYLRGSSAEEKAKRERGARSGAPPE